MTPHRAPARPNPRCSYVLQIGCWVSQCWYRVARWWLWWRPRSSCDRTVGCVSRWWAARVRVIRAWVRRWRRSVPWGVGGGSVRRWYISRAMWRFRQRIISVWVFPSASRLVTYSLVAASVRIRLVAHRP